MWCDIFERKYTDDKIFFHIKDEEGNTIIPKAVIDLNEVYFNVVHKPEWGDFVRICVPKNKKCLFQKDRVEIIEADD